MRVCGRKGKGCVGGVMSSKLAIKMRGLEYELLKPWTLAEEAWQ